MNITKKHCSLPTPDFDIYSRTYVSVLSACPINIVETENKMLMNEWEFFSYVSQLVDVCFSEVTDEQKYTLRYTNHANSERWIIDRVTPLFHSSSFSIDQNAFNLDVGLESTSRTMDDDAWS